MIERIPKFTKIISWGYPQVQHPKKQTWWIDWWRIHFPGRCAHSSKVLKPFITFCLSYLFAALEPKILWSWISLYNPSQKLNGLWHPAFLFSCRNLWPQFFKLWFNFWSSLSGSPTKLVDIECFSASIFLTCDHTSWLEIDLFDPPSLCWNQDYRSRLPSGWLTSCLKRRCAISTSAPASLYDL